MSTTFCPTCHQPIAEARAGVRLPVLKKRIFDAIRRAGSGGILLDDINAIVFDGLANPVTIRNHIRQINEALASEANFRIDGNSTPRGFYRIHQLARRS
jgi:hypothetical protein